MESFEPYEDYRCRVDYMLRRCPEIFSLQADESGWVALSDLLRCLNRSELSFFEFYSLHQNEGDQVCEIRYNEGAYQVRTLGHELKG